MAPCCMVAAVVFPDESGIVLTSASSQSSLEAVGPLKAGQIVKGFGSITTSSSITTTSTGPITSAGTFTANNFFLANSNVQIGDEASDGVHFRGVVQSNFRFTSSAGVKFEGSGTAKGKKTVFKARFTPSSPKGARKIVIPDVPTGGSLHVVAWDGSAKQISNVHQVSLDSTAGKLNSPANLALGPMQSATFALVNRRMGPKSVVVATVCDDQSSNGASDGWAMVTAVKVNQAGAGCAIVVHNVHPTNQLSTTFSVCFSVFSS
eukprot:COSAG01_NODE_8118_length_2915_cov_1.375355_4_plen_263_part_00